MNGLKEFMNITLSNLTCVAAINTNRRFIGIELDEQYFKIAENRINEAIKNKESEKTNGNKL